jgi:hypothetical protein
MLKDWRKEVVTPKIKIFPMVVLQIISRLIIQINLKSNWRYSRNKTHSNTLLMIMTRNSIHLNSNKITSFHLSNSNSLLRKLKQASQVFNRRIMVARTEIVFQWSLIRNFSIIKIRTRITIITSHSLTMAMRIWMTMMLLC